MFTPGCLFLIEQPSKVESWLGNQGENAKIPLLEVPIGIYIIDVVASGINSLPQVPISPDISKLQGFHYPKVKLILNNFFLVDTKCTGRVCDAIDAYSEGSVSKMCPCFSVISRLSQVVACFDLRVMDMSSNVLFELRHFTSRRFTNSFITGSIPVGLTASTIMHTDRAFFRTIRRNIGSIIQRINNHNGFAVTGWARRGYIRDSGSSNATASGTSGPSTGAPTSVHVAAGNLVHHAISISPNKDENGDLADVDDLLISFIVDGGGVGGVAEAV